MGYLLFATNADSSAMRPLMPVLSLVEVSEVEPLPEQSVALSVVEGSKGSTSAQFPIPNAQFPIIIYAAKTDNLFNGFNFLVDGNRLRFSYPRSSYKSGGKSYYKSCK